MIAGKLDIKALRALYNYLLDKGAIPYMEFKDYIKKYVKSNEKVDGFTRKD